ncbi:membrane protein insertion efficiency factor YidD [Litoribacter populi]|uniref:membrane protein insertion efficiency factor YidD n=1 Tax=Litoribacter populi TaxID=2598460 RepID=UPI001C8F3C84|nr:membrane protein insertion efficiency factor YidD [Litoribacter populi]
MKFLQILCLFNLLYFSGNKAIAQDEAIKDLYKFYQDYISDTRGSSCPMYPSCSKYSISSFQNHGALIGWFNTADRLMRCGHEHSYYPMSIVGNQAKLLDPVVVGELDSLKLGRPSKRFGKNLEFFRQKNDTTFFLSLINEGLYESAITEYQRMKHFGESQPPSLILEYNYYSSLAALGEYEKIIYDFEFKLNPELKTHPLILLEVGESWYHLNNYPEALTYASKIPASSSFSNNAKLFGGYVLAHQDNYDEAINKFNQVDTEYAYYDFASQNTRVVEDIAKLKKKSPALAGALGIIPGAGYLYTGHRTTAISSLLLNSLFAYATYTSFKTENYGMGILTGVFSASFYIGNITGGAKSAHRYNQAKKDQLKRKLMYSTNK